MGESGERWPFAGSLLDKAGGSEVATNAELCTRLNDLDMWICSGTMKDIPNCAGQFTYEGIYQDDVGGLYTILGGTEDFCGVNGYIDDKFDPVSEASVLKVNLY